MTSDAAHKFVSRQLSDVDKNDDPRNPRGDTDSSPRKATGPTGGVRLVPDSDPARAEATTAPTADNPNEAGESPEPALREAQVGFAPAEPPVDVSVTAAADADRSASTG